MAENCIDPDLSSEDGEKQEDEADVQIKNSQKSLFADPLPKWLVWPLDSKLPMVPAPSKVQFHTTQVGQKIVQSYPELDFNLWDPNAYETPTEYAALHDPHLHRLFESRHFREHLVKEGLITKDGKVLCDLKEFNKYRAYLNSVYQQLERTELEEPSASKSEDFKCDYCEKPSLKPFSIRRQDFHKIRAKLKKRRQLEKMVQDLTISCPAKEPTTRQKVTTAPPRTNRIQQAQERVNNKQKLDRARLQKRLTEDNEKRLQLMRERERLQAEREQIQKEQRQSKLIDIKDRQFTERQTKLHKIKQHLDLCEERAELLASQRQAKLQENQKKLKRLWDLKKSYQMNQIATNQAKSAEHEANRKKRIEQRRKSFQRQQQQQEDVIKKSAEKAQRRRSEGEKIIKQNVTKRLYSTAAPGKTKQEKGDGAISDSTATQSEFVMTESLMEFMPRLDEAKETKKSAQTYQSRQIDYSQRIQGVDPITVKIYSQLPSRHLLPPNWVPRGIPKDGWWNKDGQGNSKYAMVTCTFDPDLATKRPSTAEEAAAKCVQMVTFLASKVVYPATLRAEYEEAQAAELERLRRERQEYLLREKESKRREEGRNIRAQETQKRKAEALQKKREEEERKKALQKKREEERKNAWQKKREEERKNALQKKREEERTKALQKKREKEEREKALQKKREEGERKTDQKTTRPKKAAASKVDNQQPKKVQTPQKRPGKVKPKMARKTSSVRFDLANTVKIPTSSKVLSAETTSLVSTDSLESELVFLHESESDDPDDTEEGGLRVEANDSLTLIRNSRSKLQQDIQPTRFASLLGLEILETLQSALIQPEDVTDRDNYSSKSKSESTTEDKDLHVTPLCKILVQQVISTVTKNLGIDFPVKKKAFDRSQHNVSMKKSCINVRALKDIDLKTPATVLTLTVLEAAAKQTGTPFDRTLYAQRLETPVKKLSKTKKPSLEKASSLYRTPVKLSSDDITGAAQGNNLSSKRQDKSGSLSKLRASYDFQAGSSVTTPIYAEMTTSSPHLTIDPSPTQAFEQKETSDTSKEGTVTKEKFPRENEESHEKKKTIEQPENVDKGPPKKRNPFFACVSNLFLPKRMSSNNVKSKTEVKEADRPSPAVSGQDPPETGSDIETATGVGEQLAEPVLTVGESRSAESESSMSMVHSAVSAPVLAEPSASEEDMAYSSQIINQLVRAELSRILYKAKIQFTKKQEVEIQLGERKVKSDTNQLQDIITREVSKVLIEEKTIQPSLPDIQYDKVTDSCIIETVVHHELNRILVQRNLELREQKSMKSKDPLLRESKYAFQAIMKAYSSEMEMGVEDLGRHLDAWEERKESGAKQSQHPIHIEMLKRIASKIEKEDALRKIKGLDRYRNVASSMLTLDLVQDRTSKEYLQSVAECYRHSLREYPTKCTAESEIEDVLKNNLITAINLIREGIMANHELTELVSAVVASYLIAHSILPLSEDTSSDYSTLSKYKGLELGKDLSTPVLIDTLIAEILDNVKHHLRIGTFNAAHVIFSVYGMHENSIEITERKEAEVLAEKSSSADVQSSSDEDIIAITETAGEDVDFVPMFGDQPLKLGKEEASSALIALSVKDPDQIDDGTDPVERNSFYSLVKPDVSRLKTFSDTDRDVNEEAARKHLSAVSMQFKKRSETKFGSSVQAAMKCAINYDKLKRGSHPVVGSMTTPEKVDEESDESDEDDQSKKRRSQLRSQSLTHGINVDNIPKITDPERKTSKIKPKVATSSDKANETRSDLQGRVVSSKDSIKSTNSGKSKGSVGSEGPGSRLLGSRPLDTEEYAEVPPEDPELVRLSARREQRAQEKAAEKISSIKIKASISSNKTISQPSAVASTRQSQISVGTGLTPRPSDAFRSERTASYQDAEQQRQIRVQTYDLNRAPDQEDNHKAVQMTGNEAAVQTSSSIIQCGRLGDSEAVGTDSLALLTPLTISENSSYEYAQHVRLSDTGETFSDGAIELSKRHGDKAPKKQPEDKPDKGKKTSQRPSLGPVVRMSSLKQQEIPLEGSYNALYEDISDQVLPEQLVLTKDSSNTLVEEIVEYEEITQIETKPKGRRMSFVPNFAAVVPVVGSYGQQSRRMSYFPEFEQNEERTRSVLEETMTVELPTSQNNRENFTMDEDDDVQSVSPLVSVASANLIDDQSQDNIEATSGKSPSSLRKKLRYFD